MGMMRFKTEEEFTKFRRKTGVRESTSTNFRDAATRAPLRTPAPTESAPAGVSPPVVVAPRQESEIERRFAQQVRTAGLPEPEREYYHITGRDFRLDFAWPTRKIGVEVQGMSHRIKSKFHADIEKRALALLAGWRILEVSGDTVRNEQGIKWVTELLAFYIPGVTPDER